MMRQKLTNEQRFNSKFIIDNETNCWLWTAGKRDIRGYGQFHIRGKNVSPHRFSYEMYREPIPIDMTIDHLCKNPSCVNPLHLEVVTRIENVSRGNNKIMKNSQLTHCTRGHPYSGDNLYIKPNGERDCKTCNLIRNKNWRDKKRS